MNELQLIRAQTATERRHLFEISRGLANAVATNEGALRSAAEYLGAVAKRWARRVQAHCTALQPVRASSSRPGAQPALASATPSDLQPMPASNGGSGAQSQTQREQLPWELEQAAQLAGSILAAVEHVETRLREAAHPRQTELLEAVGACFELLRAVPANLEEKLEAAAGQHYSIAQWRAVAHVDADAILQERALYAALCAQLR